MNYYLLKRLQLAKFPQEGEGKMTFNPDQEGPHELVYQPTFSELVDECGEEFGSVSRHGKGFMACRLKHAFNVCYEGRTPEESVAYMYLAIKE